MANDNKELVSSMLRKMTKLNYIKPGDVPGINLYMDQVTTFMDEHLSDSKRHEDDKILTKTMINNYTKNNLLPPPVKKKYSRDHLYILAFIYYLKNLLSISDIQKLINPLTENCFDTEKYLTYANHKPQLSQEIHLKKHALPASHLNMLKMKNSVISLSYSVLYHF